jgi:thioredoxin 1
VRNLTADTFQTTVNADGIVLVDWWASWCGPCRAFAPTFEAAAEKYDDIVFAKVDTEANPSLAASAGIMSIPTLMAFRDGILVFSRPGALPAAALDDLITQVRALDMDSVRAEIAAAEPERGEAHV